MSTSSRCLIGTTFRLHPFPWSTCRRAGISKYQTHDELNARHISNSAPLWSGHSKWASIKHDKAKVDAARNKQRSIFAREIENAVKLGGPNPNQNPRLALAISTAKKAAVPKTNIETAIARGQGISASGAALESVTLEAMVPPSIATIIDCQTDNRLRTLADLRLLVKEAGGNVSSISFMFEKKGRIIFRKKEGTGPDEVLDAALEAGALDVVEDEQGRVVLYTEPGQTKATGEQLAKELEMEIEESEIIYDPQEDTMATLDDETEAKNLNEFLGEVQEVTGVQGVYVNWKKGSISDELWTELQSKVTV